MHDNLYNPLHNLDRNYTRTRQSWKFGRINSLRIRVTLKYLKSGWIQWVAPRGARSVVWIEDRLRPRGGGSGKWQVMIIAARVIATLVGLIITQPSGVISRHYHATSAKYSHYLGRENFAFDQVEVSRRKKSEKEFLRSKFRELGTANSTAEKKSKKNEPECCWTVILVR